MSDHGFSQYSEAYLETGLGLISPPTNSELDRCDRVVCCGPASLAVLWGEGEITPCPSATVSPNLTRRPLPNVDPPVPTLSLRSQSTEFSARCKEHGLGTAQTACQRRTRYCLDMSLLRPTRKHQALPETPSHAHLFCTCLSLPLCPSEPSCPYIAPPSSAFPSLPIPLSFPPFSQTLLTSSSPPSS